MSVISCLCKAKKQQVLEVLKHWKHIEMLVKQKKASKLCRKNNPAAFSSFLLTESSCQEFMTNYVQLLVHKAVKMYLTLCYFHFNSKRKFLLINLI